VEDVSIRVFFLVLFVSFRFSPALAIRAAQEAQQLDGSEPFSSLQSRVASEYRDTVAWQYFTVTGA
jgi:hypothetical protein